MTRTNCRLTFQQSNIHHHCCGSGKRELLTWHTAAASAWHTHTAPAAAGEALITTAASGSPEFAGRALAEAAARNPDAAAVVLAEGVAAATARGAEGGVAPLSQALAQSALAASSAGSVGAFATTSARAFGAVHPRGVASAQSYCLAIAQAIIVQPGVVAPVWGRCFFNTIRLGGIYGDAFVTGAMIGSDRRSTCFITARDSAS